MKPDIELNFAWFYGVNLPLYEIEVTTGHLRSLFFIGKFSI